MRSGRRLAAASLAVVAAVVVAALALRDTGGAPPSFSREVAPILRNACASCHRSGGIAPFSLESAQTAKGRALAIAAQVESRRMPPWPPGPASPELAGADRRRLSEEQIETVVEWARGGAEIDGPALRAPRDPPLRPGADERLVELELPDAYTPAGSGDDYRCFLLDPQLRDDAFVTSAVIRPGAPAVVHHVILFRAQPGQLEEAERLDAGAAGPGWRCFGGTGLTVGVDSLADAGWISAWAPGSQPVRYAAGTGAQLAAGTGVVMQVHYNLRNGRAADRTAAALTLAPATAGLQPAATMLVPAPVELACAPEMRSPLCDRTAAVADLTRARGSSAALLPAGLQLLCGGNPFSPRSGRVSSCDRPFEARTTIYGVAGHMHLLGTSIRIELNPGTDRSRVLLDIPRWDFRWQSAYMLEEPVVAEPGDTVRVTCRHDASLRAGEPRYIVWGEGTTDEMCLGVLQVTRG